jgi:hypothetical protein
MDAWNIKAVLSRIYTMVLRSQRWTEFLSLKVLLHIGQ